MYFTDRIKGMIIMVLERMKLRGSTSKFNFSNFYVGITKITGAIFIATNFNFRLSFLKSYNTKFYAIKVYKNIKAERDRFIALEAAEKFASICEQFINNLAEWETPSDVDNMFSETRNIHENADERASTLSSKHLALNNGIFKPNDDYTMN